LIIKLPVIFFREKNLAVLLVSDHYFEGMELQGMLHDSTLQYYEAQSSRQALQLLETHPDIDLALIDASLSGTGAWPLTVYIRLAFNRSLQIVMLSTFSMPAMYLALQCGCDELLAKPCSPEIIKAAIDRHLKNNKYKKEST